MPEIVVDVGFDITLKDGSVESVPAGKSEVSEEVASHWFTKAHLTGVPRGLMPIVEGEKGLMIEADEAGQRVTPVLGLADPSVPVRQEGPVAWSAKNPVAKELAQTRAKDAGTQPSEPVDGKKEAAARSSPDKDAAIKAAAAAQASAASAAATAAAANPSPAVSAATARMAATQPPK